MHWPGEVVLDQNAVFVLARAIALDDFEQEFREAPFA